MFFSAIILCPLLLRPSALLQSLTIKPPDHHRGIVPAEAEAVADGDVDLRFAGGVRHVIEIALVIRVFQIDLAAGTVVFYTNNPDPFTTSHSPVTLVSSGTYAAPSAASVPQATLNRITFNRPLTKAFPAGTLISSMLLLGDLQSRVGAAFAQETWGNIWADARIGSSIVPQYQQVSNPITVSNRGAISERWAIIFTSPTAFRVVGETVGQIVSNGDINSNLSPPNPAAAGQPYFTLLATGWGTGWSAGNVLRFNTVGANAPIWVARAVLPSAPNTTPDSLTVAVRGDIDA